MVGEAERWDWYGRIALNPDNLMIALHVKSYMSDTQALGSNASLKFTTTFRHEGFRFAI
jgi:hypothetical protein